MDWLTFVTNIVDAIAWPVVVLAAVFLLRGSIASVLPGLRRAKYKDLEFEFGQKLEEIAEKAKRAELPDRPEPPEWVFQNPDQWTFGDYIERLSIVSPRVAIVEAWRVVELALADAAKRHGLPARQIARVAGALEAEGWLAHDAVAMVNELRALRNRAVHAEDFDLQPDQGVEYGRLAERVIASIKVDGARPEGGDPRKAT